MTTVGRVQLGRGWYLTTRIGRRSGADHPRDPAVLKPTRRERRRPRPLRRSLDIVVDPFTDEDLGA